MIDRNTIIGIIKINEIKKGNLILLHYWGEEEHADIIHTFEKELMAIGASPFVIRQSRKQNADKFGTALDGCFGEKYFKLLDEVTIVFDIFAYPPVILDQKLSDDKMQIYRSYMRGLFEKLVKAEKLIQMRLPTSENAEESNLEYHEFVKRMETAYDVDYESIHADCIALIKELGKQSSIQIITGDSCELSFDLEGRTWYADYGNGDLPCGEIYIAPNETKTNGHVFFSELSSDQFGDEIFYNITIQVADGVIINSDNKEFNKHINEYEELRIGELGIGMNPNVTSMCGFSVLDEKMKGSFHIGIGANTVFGGTIQSNVHFDLTGIGRIGRR